MEKHLQPLTEIISRCNRDEGLRDNSEAARQVIEYLTKEGFRKMTVKGTVKTGEAVLIDINKLHVV